ncbi:MAG: hypothetical protein JST81_07310 [Bacteroidetes bacterium]|nr:hypothetical protein [Bacteroidota bacterium]
MKDLLHPAGHIIGSAQVRLKYNNEVWVFSGDFKTEDDGLSTPFEPVTCHTFVTESTFGLPVYTWKTQNDIFENIRLWATENNRIGNCSVFTAYS